MNDTVVLSGDYNLEIKIDGECSLSTSVDGSGQIGIPILGGDPIETYDGDYEIIPQQISQILLTKKKKLVDDITVRGIPYFEVSNLDGITVNIGG